MVRPKWRLRKLTWISQVQKKVICVYTYNWRITTDEYDKIVKDYKSEQQRLLIEYEEHSEADGNFYITANKLIELSSRAWELFESSEVEEKRQLLNFLLQNSYLQGKNALFELKIPFSGILEYANSGSLLALIDMFRTLDSIKIMQELELRSFAVYAKAL